nr:hypothetical protein Iba_chr05cCG5630 [Ipomoea batatas]
MENLMRSSSARKAPSEPNMVKCTPEAVLEHCLITFSEPIAISYRNLRKNLGFRDREAGIHEYPLSKNPDTPDTVSSHRRAPNISHHISGGAALCSKICGTGDFQTLKTASRDMSFQKLILYRYGLAEKHVENQGMNRCEFTNTKPNLVVGNGNVASMASKAFGMPDSSHTA